MKLLLDENLPHRFRHELPGHDCYTVTFMGFTGLENGKLLARAAEEGFDALLTKDTNLQYQQNLVDLPLSVVVLHAASNDINDLLPLVPALRKALINLEPVPQQLKLPTLQGHRQGGRHGRSERAGRALGG